MTTLAQICNQAAQVAKAPGMTAIAGQWLNTVLEELKLVRDLKVNRVTQIVTVTSGTYGPFPLEADYLRTYDMSYPLSQPNGETQFLYPVTMAQWDAEFKGVTTANYPYEFATDTSTQAQVWSGGTQGSGTLTSAGFFNIYPQSNGTLNITHRYMKNQPDYANPQSSSVVPWFPYTLYLITRVAGEMMGTSGDDRRAEYLGEAERMLQPYLCNEGDEQQTVRRVELDPRHFRSNRAVRPTKVLPY